MKEALQIKYVLNDMQLVSNTLLGLHAYTGYDMVSAFACKGKVKPNTRSLTLITLHLKPKLVNVLTKTWVIKTNLQ